MALSWRPLVAGIAVVTALSASGTALAQSPLSPEEFAVRLERAVAMAEQGSREPSVAKMDEVRATVGLPAEIELANQVVLVPADGFLDSIPGENAADFEQATERLRAWLRAVEGAQEREVPDGHTVQQALEEAYRGVVQIEPTVLDRILQTATAVLSAVLHRLTNFAGFTSVLAWGTVLGLAAVALLLLRRARLVPDRMLPASAGGHGSPARVDWARTAEEALRAGDLRAATRALYLALVATLAGQGLVAESPALTAGEARAAVRRARPAIYQLVAPAIDSYERVVYGGATPDVSDIERLREARAKARAT